MSPHNQFYLQGLQLWLYQRLTWMKLYKLLLDPVAINNSSERTSIFVVKKESFLENKLISSNYEKTTINFGLRGKMCGHEY